ncbi:hypothetical protein [Bordetella sp. BOR01]|uniref:DUF6963 family protein n=1 Tax=Bordetella sp. BOR01 TaxID=2854779 RepID=UPI001C468103|nr:hypothetical protein [Bordetella sp. BOR01]MBV7483513.1 hypothetical protein [Bordetella sp. BOR01]
MTIGIAASGPRAGAAVRAAVLGAELLGRGAIGGFAVYAVLDEHGRPHYCTTQRGGIGHAAIPEAWLDASVAAAISSGPDRPEPLVQFLPGAEGVGLVAGHRLPNRPGADGVPLNQAVLSRLAAGQAPQQALDAVLAANAEADAGLVAVSARGELGWGNSARVARRSDRGEAHRRDASGSLALLHNSIYSYVPQGLADALAELAWAQIQGRPAGWQFLALRAPVAIRPAARDRVLVDAAGAIVALETADPHVPMLNRRGTAIYLGAEVWLGERKVGRIATELYADLAAGMAHPLPGAAQHTILMRAGDVAA